VNSRGKSGEYQFSSLTLPIQGTPMNNRIKLILPATIQSLGYIFAADSRPICVALLILQQFCPEAMNTRTHDKRTPREFQLKIAIHLWSFKPSRSCISV